MPGKIPVFRTVLDSYASLKEGLDDLARMGRRWSIGAGATLAFPVLLMRVPADPADPRMGSGAPAVAGLGLFIGVSVLAVYVLVTRWHRRLILSQGADETRHRSVPSSFLYMARCSLLVAIGFGIAMLAFLPLVFIRSSIGDELQRGAVVAVLAVGALAALLMSVRMSLILPAAAVSDFTMTAQRSFAMTRGNSMRLLAGTLLSAAPALVLSVFIRMLENERSTQATDVPQYIALTVITVLMLGLAAIVQASFLSFCYLHFTRDETAAQAVQAPPALPR